MEWEILARRNLLDGIAGRVDRKRYRTSYRNCSKKYIMSTQNGSLFKISQSELNSLLVTLVILTNDNTFKAHITRRYG